MKQFPMFRYNQMSKEKNQKAIHISFITHAFATQTYYPAGENSALLTMV